jgi:hypothetical protein
MTPEAIVRAKYPDADLQYNDPVAGADLQHDREGHWVVYQFRELGTRLLGRGPTAGAAWIAAAALIQEETQS